MAVDELDDLVVPRIIGHIVGLVEDTEGHVQHVRRLVVGAVPLLVLDRVEKRKRPRNLVETALEGFEVGEGSDSTRTERLLVLCVDHVSEIADRCLPARRLTARQCQQLHRYELVRDDSLSSKARRGGRGGGLAEIEPPCKHVRCLTIVHAIPFLVVKGEQSVRLVRTSDIDLESSYTPVHRQHTIWTCIRVHPP